MTFTYPFAGFSKVWGASLKRSEPTVLARGDLWLHGYLLANPEDENLSVDYSGDETNLFEFKKLKSASATPILKAMKPGRLQSLCLYGSACESYNQHAIMAAENSDASRVDKSLPKDINRAIQREVHRAIDSTLDEQDLEHKIKEGSPTNVFRADPTRSTISLSTASRPPAKYNQRAISDADLYSSIPLSPQSDRTLRSITTSRLGSFAESEEARDPRLLGRGAAFQVRRAIRAFRQYEAATAAAAAADAAAEAAVKEAAAETAAARAGTSRTAPLRRRGAQPGTERRTPAMISAAPPAYPPLPAY